MTRPPQEHFKIDDSACWALLAVIFGVIVGSVIAVVILIAANLFVTSTKRQPLNVLRLLAFIAAAAILIGFIVPGIVASVSGVYYQKDIESVVYRKFPTAKQSMDDFFKNKTSHVKT